MSLDSDIALLRGIPLLAGLSSEQLRLITFGAVRLGLGQGQVLFRAGSKALSGYVVLDGRVQLTTGEAGRRQIVATCEAGSLIGELALFVETRRPATATALADSEVLEIERKVVLRLLNEHPDVALRLRAMLAERLTATVSELSRVGHRLAGSEVRPGV
jgi:CRP-like cAMP-binding protein